MYSLQTLGRIDLRDADGQPVSSILAQPQLLAVLVYLAGNGSDTFHRRDKLIGLIWPEASDAQARRRLNQVLYELRRALGDDVVVSRGKEDVGVVGGRLQIDLEQFRSALQADDPKGALELYRGDFLSGFYVSAAPGLARWIDRERETLRREALEAAGALAREHRDVGDHEAALPWARRAAEIAPESESALRSWMMALRNTGDRVRALEAFEAFRRHLASDFEMEPSEETVRLAEEIRTTGAVASDAPHPEIRPPAVATADEANVPARAAPRANAPLVPAPTAGRHPAPPAPNLGRTLAGAGVALLGIAAVVWTLLTGGGAPALLQEGATPVVLVVPVSVEGAVPQDLGDLGSALTGELRDRLSSIPGLVVVPPEVIEPHARSGARPLEIGRDLDADVVVEGSLEWREDGTRSTAEVIHVGSGESIWRQAHSHAPGEVFLATHDITVGVASALGLGYAERPAPALPSGDELSTWALVGQARDILDSNQRPWSPLETADFDRIHALVDRAIEMAPNHAPAHAVRSLAYFRRWQESDRQNDWLDSARVVAERAVSIGPDDYLSQLALSKSILLRGQNLPLQDRRRALEAILRTIQLNPSDPEVALLLAKEWMGTGRNLLWGDRSRMQRRAFGPMYQYRAHWFWLLGDFDTAIEAYGDLAELAAGRPGYQVFRVAEIELSRGNLSEARRGVEATLRDRPGDDTGRRIPLWARIYPTAVTLELTEGNYEAAERLLDEMLGRDRPIETVGTSGFDARTALAFVYLKTGRTAEGTALAESLLREYLDWSARTAWFGAYGAPYEVARIYSILGDSDRAIHWMNVAIERGWPWYYTTMGMTDPMLEAVRDDPRFIELMEAAKATLDTERAWVQEVMALPEPERFQRMVEDAESKLRALWEESGS